MAWAKGEGFFTQKANNLKAAFEKEGIICRVLF
jgi:hypothetical protein